MLCKYCLSPDQPECPLLTRVQGKEEPPHQTSLAKLPEGAPHPLGQLLPPHSGSLGQGLAPCPDQPSPHTLPPCTGCQPGPGHPPEALLRLHPPSQGKCPAGHHPPGPESHLRAGGHLPGLLHLPGQVRSPPSLPAPLSTVHPPPGRGHPALPSCLPTNSHRAGSPEGALPCSFTVHLPGPALGKHHTPSLLSVTP